MIEPTSHSLVKALRAVPDFAELDDPTLLEIVGASANLFWSAGSLVFEAGATAEALYVVLSGRASIVEVVDGQERTIAEISQGDYFGEHALLLHTTHSKSARTLEDSEFLVVPKDSFQPLLAANPELAAHFRRKLEKRLLELGGRPDV
jgi:CRP-like cAMP-binding protein